MKKINNSNNNDSCWKLKNEKDIFKNINNKKVLQKTVYKYILNGNNNFENIIDVLNGQNIKFIRISAKEFVYGRNNNTLQENQYIKKLRVASSINNLINNATIKYHSPLKHKNSLFSNGFNNYQGKVEIDNEKFRYIVRIGISKKLESIFYDISFELLQ